MQKIIEFADKVALNENADIPETNKITDDNINEIKAVVNGSLQGTNAMGSIVVDDVSGKNLFDGSSMIELNGQVRRYSDGVIVSVSGYYGIKVPVKANTTYIVSSDLADRNKISNLCYFNGGTYISGATFDSGSLSFTTPNNCNYVTLAVSNEYTWLQIELGTEATDFVEYKQPVKITNVGVKESITFYANDFKCKNMFNYNSSKFGYVLGGSGAESASSGFLISDYIPVTPNTIYTISRVFNNVSGAENTMRIGYYQQNKTFIDRPASSDNPYTITTPSNCYYVRLSYQYQSQGQTSNDKVQLEVGSATPYTPYKAFATEYKWDIIQQQDVAFSNDSQAFNIPNISKYDRIRVAVNNSYNRTFFFYFEKNDLIGNTNIFQQAISMPNGELSSLALGRITLNITNSTISIIYDKANATFPLTLKNIVGYYRGEQTSSSISGTRMLSVVNEEENR